MDTVIGVVSKIQGFSFFSSAYGSDRVPSRSGSLETTKKACLTAAVGIHEGYLKAAEVGRVSEPGALTAGITVQTNEIAGRVFAEGIREGRDVGCECDMRAKNMIDKCQECSNASSLHLRRQLWSHNRASWD